jgi:hypothetical protein
VWALSTKSCYAIGEGHADAGILFFLHVYSVEVILSLGCSVISIAFYYLCGDFSLLMPYWL